MGKTRQLQFGAINITLPSPHRTDRYVKLFQRAFAEKIAVSLQGDWVGLIGGVPIEDDANSPGEKIIRGEFYKYIDLKTGRDWFNVKKGKPADADDLELLNIPEELKPHFQIMSFVFFTKGHRLILVTKDGQDSLSVRQAATILKKVFESKNILGEFGHVDVVIEPARETIDAIFNMKRLRSLEILVTPPNPDDFEEYEKELFEDMNTQRAGALHLSMQESDSRGLLPGEKIRKLAKVAQSNGKVVGVGGLRGATTTLSTTNHPIMEKASFDYEAYTRRDFLLQKARDIMKRIRAN